MAMLGARTPWLTGVACLLATGLRAAPPADTIVVGLSADASTFETAEIRSADNINIANYLFTTLTQIGDDGSILPRLATGWSVSEDGKSLTFTLPTGRTCEDGEALTAEDVAFSWNRAADPVRKFAGNTPGFVYTSLGFERAEAIDPTTVRIHIAARNPMALGFTSQVMIHCKDSLEKMSDAEIATRPVSSGEYRLVSWTRNASLVLEKRQDPGTFKTIIFRVIPETSTRTAELLAGNVDIITNVSPDQVAAINASGRAKVQAVQGLRRMYIGFNQKPSFDGVDGRAFKKPEVRRALQYAVDVPAICSQLLGMPCRRMTGMVNPPNDHPTLEPYPFDPAKAEKLLDEAGYPRGADGIRFRTKLQTPRGRYLNDVNVALAVGAFLTDVGVATEVEVLDWASVYTPLIRNHDAGPLFLLGSGGVLWSAVYDMAILARVNSGPNYTEWSDPRWFGRWDEMMNERDPARQRQIINEMLEVFYHDGPWLHMYYQPDFYGVSNRVNWVARRDETIDLWDVQLTK